MTVLRVALDDIPEYCRPDHGAVTRSQQHIMRNCFRPVFEWHGGALTSSFFEEWSWDGRLFRGRVTPMRLSNGRTARPETVGQAIHRKFELLQIRHRLDYTETSLAFEVDETFGPLLSVLTEEDVLVTDNGIGTTYGVTAWDQGYVQLDKVTSLGGHQLPDTVQFISYKSADAILDALLSDEIDLAYEVPYRVLREGHPQVKVTVAPIRSMNGLQFNCQRISASVRRLIRDNIDLTVILNSVHEGIGIVPDGLFPTGTLGYAHSTRHNREDRAVLNLSGNLPHELELITRPAPIAVQRWGRAIAEPLRELGINVRIVPLSVGETVARMQRGDFDMAQLGFQIGPDPYAFLRGFFSRTGITNLTGFYSPQFEKLLEVARETASEEARHLLYFQMQSIIRSEVPVIPTRQGYSIVACRVTNPVPLDPHQDGIIIVERGRWG